MPITTEYRSGVVHREIHLRSNKYHRVDGPATIEYYENGQVMNEMYYDNDILHRANGPAFIDYYESGQVQREEYHLNNKQHRSDGPAVIDYFDDGTVWALFYFKDDMMLDPEAFKDVVDPKTGLVTDKESFEFIWNML